jgi:hypothetical protein
MMLVNPIELANMKYDAGKILAGESLRLGLPQSQDDVFDVVKRLLWAIARFEEETQIKEAHLQNLLNLLAAAEMRKDLK